LKIIELIH